MEEAPVARPLTERLEQIVKPISEKEPAGVDVTYEDSFQNLKNEINKIGSASGGAEFDQIVSLAMRILSEQSKDLNAAGYLALGLCRTDGWNGVAEGFAAVRLLSETFWEDLFPLKRRMAARKNTMQFVVERLGEWMELNQPSPPDREAVAWTLEEVEALQSFAMEEMADDAPAFSLVLRVLRDNLRRLPDPAEVARKAEEEARKAAEAREAAASAPAGDGAPGAGAAPVIAPGGAVDIKSSAEAAQLVYRLAAQLREQNAYDPLAHRLVRVMRFGILQALPPAEGGKTRVEPPPRERRQALAGMLEQGKFEVLAKSGEDALLEQGMHFWLDLQRLVAGALAALGAPAKAAHLAVVEEAASLARRLPGLERLTFADGTPFADPVTADWLAEIAASGEGGGEGGERDEELTAHLEEAKKLAAGGDIGKAVRTLSVDGRGPRAAFQRRLAAADLCFKAGRPEVAAPIVEALDEVVQRHQLESWEPGLAVAALRLMHRAYEALEAKAPPADKPAYRQRGEAAFARMCRVDPAAALG
jgi:type VI secretion system protein VasJ